MSLVNNPRFAPTSFKGRAKLNGVADYQHQFPLTKAGYIELLTGQEAHLGCFVSRDPARAETVRLGMPAGYIPCGFLMFEEGIAQNDPAHNDQYFDGEAVTYAYMGGLYYSRWGVGTGLKGPSLGSQVLFNNDTGEIGFIDYNDSSVPSGWTLTNAQVIETDTPNGALVFVTVPVVSSVGEDVTGTVATPVAAPGAGAVAQGTEVAITTTTLGADIYYTLDGSNPSGNSIHYVAPIPVEAAVTIKAVAIKQDMANSAVLTAAYTLA
jgi:hypothetical protein